MSEDKAPPRLMKLVHRIAKEFQAQESTDENPSSNRPLKTLLIRTTAAESMKRFLISLKTIPLKSYSFGNRIEKASPPFFRSN